MQLFRLFERLFVAKPIYVCIKTSGTNLYQFYPVIVDKDGGLKWF
jgi:hypothetical protein